MPKPEEFEIPTPPETFDLTVEEYCARESARGAAVELLGGFHSDETVNGRVKDSEANFAARFAAFAVRPA